MNCIYCGNSIPDNSVVCMICGNPVPQANQAGTAYAPYGGASQENQSGAAYAPYGEAQPTAPVGADYAPYGEAQPTAPVGDHAVYEGPQAGQNGSAYAPYGEAQPTAPVGDYTVYEGQQAGQNGSAYAPYGEAQPTAPVGDYAVYEGPQADQAGAAYMPYGEAQPTAPVGDYTVYEGQQADQAGAAYMPYGEAQPTTPVGADYAPYGEATPNGPAEDYTVYEGPQANPAGAAYSPYGEAPPVNPADAASAQNGDAPQEKSPKRGKRKLIAAISAAVLAVLVGVGVWYLWFNPTYAAYAKDKCDLSKESVSIYVGESYEFTVDNSISTSDKSILTVDGKSVTGVKPGEVTVKSSVFPYSSTCTVNVLEEKITFKGGDQLELYVGQTLDPEITIDGITEKKDVTWSSDDAAVATVSAGGTVSGVSTGSTTITASLPGGGKSTCKVEVKPDEVVLKDSSERKIAVGETVTIEFEVDGISEAKDVTWKTSDPAVATVDENGAVTGVKQGTATITASLPNNTSTACQVTVKADGISIVAPESNKVVIGTPVLLEVRISGSTDRREVTWSSDNTSVATVDGRGTVSGKAPGAVTITATLPNGETGTCKLTVEPPVVSQRNGFVKRPAGSEVAPVTIHAPSDASAYVFFKSQDNNRNDFSVFVNAGTTAEVHAPTGKYDVYYASGAEWHGPEYKFGEGTQYYRADGEFEFYVSGNQVYGTELTLSLVQDGNLGRKSVDASEFPG